MEKLSVLREPDEIFKAYAKCGHDNPTNILAFYNGAINSIIVNKDLVMIRYIDKMVHRGYAAFDSCTMINNRFYLFEKRMNRFYNSMKLMHIVPTKTKEELKSIMSQMAIALGRENLYFRLWCSRGDNTFSIYTPPEVPTIFYISASEKSHNSLNGTEPSSARTTKTEVKGNFYASVKSNNYLLNALASFESHEIDGSVPVMVSAEGYVLESCIDALSFITKDKIYYAPPFIGALRSITQERVLEIVQKDFVEKGKLKGICRDRKKVNELIEIVEEMFLLGGDEVTPISAWDGRELTKGIGPITQEIIDALDKDYDNHEVTVPIDK